MAGIGGTAYGESQYASSGSEAFGNKLFKEFLYFQEERSWLTTFSYVELIEVAETFATHLVEIWIKLVDYITVTHVRTGISISKFITEALSLQEEYLSVITKKLQELLTALESFALIRKADFEEYLGVLFQTGLTVGKSFKEVSSVIQSVASRISGVFSRDDIDVTSEQKNSKITKTFKEVVAFLESMRRKLNGLLMGWNKKEIQETDWDKRDNVDTTWEKTGRPDV